jgi:hypothetical protein
MWRFFATAAFLAILAGCSNSSQMVKAPTSYDLPYQIVSMNVMKLATSGSTGARRKAYTTFLQVVHEIAGEDFARNESSTRLRIILNEDQRSWRIMFKEPGYAVNWTWWCQFISSDEIDKEPTHVLVHMLMANSYDRYGSVRVQPSTLISVFEQLRPELDSVFKRAQAKTGNMVKYSWVLGTGV